MTVVETELHMQLNKSYIEVFFIKEIKDGAPQEVPYPARSVRLI